MLCFMANMQLRFMTKNKSHLALINKKASSNNINNNTDNNIIIKSVFILFKARQCYSL